MGMSMFVLFAFLVLSGGALYTISHRKMMKRIQDIERDLQGYADVILKVAEAQNKASEKASSRFEELDERIMELSVPSRDSDLPLERRHQVLALARQGVALEDIVKRLKAPVGEAELILNLHKFRGGASRRAEKTMEQAVRHA
jgi:hypothetical protein